MKIFSASIYSAILLISILIFCYLRILQTYTLRAIYQPYPVCGITAIWENQIVGT